MALTLLEARNEVRRFTRHVNDTTRLTDAVLNGYLNKEYRKLRSWLIDVAPQLYMVQSGEFTLPDATTGEEIHLRSDSYQYEKLYRVEELRDEQWVEVEMANPLSFDIHQTGRHTFREEAGCLIFGPTGEVDGTFRVQFHATPANLTNDATEFAIPHHLEDALKYATCVKVALADGDSPKDWNDMLKEELKKAKPELAKRFGVHVQRSGLRKVMPY